MNHRLIPALLCSSCLLLCATWAAAQDPAEPTAEPAETEAAAPELTYDDYFVKGYTISVFGGTFKGDQYLDLPVKDPRSYVTPDSRRIMSYSTGEFFTEGELNYDQYDGAVKELEDGNSFGFKLGTHITDQFHVDIDFTYSTTQAVLRMTNKGWVRGPEGEFQNLPSDEWVVEEIDRDPDVKVYRAGLTLNYDFLQYRLFGIYPALGFGFGGVITRFSVLDDTGGLYFTGKAGLHRPLAGGLSIFAEYDATVFAMSRDELDYTTMVTFQDLRIGLGWFIDVVPPEVRERRARELEGSG